MKRVGSWFGAFMLLMGSLCNAQVQLERQSGTISIYHPSIASGAAGTLVPDVTGSRLFAQTITSPTSRETGFLQTTFFNPTTAQRTIRSAGSMFWTDVPSTATQGFSRPSYGMVDWFTYRGQGTPAALTGHRTTVYTGDANNYNVTFPLLTGNLVEVYPQYNSSVTDVEGVTAWVEVDSTGPNTTGIALAKNYAAYCTDGASGTGGANITTCYNYYAGANSAWPAVGRYSFYAEPDTGPAKIPDGLMIGSTTAKPTCDVTQRGKFYHFFAGAGAKDTVEVCAKAADNSYAWRVLY
jgi:hypothetical protein